MLHCKFQKGCSFPVCILFFTGVRKKIIDLCIESCKKCLILSWCLIPGSAITFHQCKDQIKGFVKQIIEPEELSSCQLLPLIQLRTPCRTGKPYIFSLIFSEVFLIVPPAQQGEYMYIGLPPFECKCVCVCMFVCVCVLTLCTQYLMTGLLNNDYTCMNGAEKEVDNDSYIVIKS